MRRSKGKLSPETKSRVQRLIDSAKRGPNAAEVRQLRAVRALELAATPTARDHLKALAGGAEGATLTRAAAEALETFRVQMRRAGSVSDRSFLGSS